MVRLPGTSRKKVSKDSRLVYSSDPRIGRCLTCGKPSHECKCKIDRPSKKPDEQDIRVRREVNGRGGKTVTAAMGFALSAADLAALAKELKNKCACGGTAAEGSIELQGDHRDKVVDLLTAKGFRVKKAGG